MITYAVHDNDWKVRDIFTPTRPIEEVVHPGVLYLFVEIPEGVDVQIGDIYDRERGVWSHPDIE